MKSYLVVTTYIETTEVLGGGVMIAISDNFNSEQLNNIEAIAVSINCKKRLNFGIVYIPPNLPDSYHNSVTSFVHSLPLKNNTP